MSRKHRRRQQAHYTDFEDASFEGEYLMKKFPEPEELKPINDKLEEYHRAMANPKIEAVVVGGFAGVGKTKTFAYYAAKAVREGKKVILLRPNIVCGPEIGFLKGDILEKTLPFHRQIVNYLADYLGYQEPLKLLSDEVVEVQPFATLQGRDLSNYWVFCDEAQNLTADEMYILVTRGADKFVACGDTTSAQILNNKVDSLDNGLSIFLETMGDLPSVATVVFDKPEYILRKGLVKEVILRMLPVIESLKAARRVEKGFLNN